MKCRLKPTKNNIQTLHTAVCNYNKSKDACSYMETVYPYNDMANYYIKNYCKHCSYYTLGCTDEWMRSKALKG